MRLVLVQPQLQFENRELNQSRVKALLSSLGPLSETDLVLLPEHWEIGSSREEYLRAVADLASEFGAHVIGGSQHQDRPASADTPAHRLNRGAVMAPNGTLLGEYDKLRPYALERHRVEPGTLPGEIDILGRRVLVLICADFWFTDLFQQAAHVPDLVLVPALSVSRKTTPHYSRSLWQHLAVARAYEFGCYVGISDWAHPSKLPMLSTSGVAGFADPTGEDPAHFFSPLAPDPAPATESLPGQVQTFELDFSALDRFRADRIERGFFWKKPD